MTTIIYINPMPKTCETCPIVCNSFTGEAEGCTRIKPLVLCGECAKWKTDNCIRWIWDKDRHAHPDPDDFCKDGVKA